MNKTVYLPFVSGLLTAYAKTFKPIQDVYRFMPPRYKRATPDEIVSQYDNPAVACFSVSLWNYELSIEVATRLKNKFSDCIIIFGGPSAPENGCLKCVDFIINGEGEKKFVNLLASIAGLCQQVSEDQPKDLDRYPSPYVTGEYDDLLKDDMTFQVIVETTRGCPFQCAYCYWGMGGRSKKFRFHSLDYIKAEAEWIGQNKIKYVFCADSNFGMHKRDIEIAKIYAETKKKYRYPEKFRVCYGKNAEESIYQTAKILSDAGMSKSVTLSKQSDNPIVLANVGRKNIRQDVYEKLQARYDSDGIQTYTEIILGLPGETLQSFKNGVYAAIKSNTNLFIYHCVVLPNTEMASEEYRRKHGIKTVRVPLSEIHCEPRAVGSIQEYEEIIIKTFTMSRIDWIQSAVFSWCTQLRYSFGIKNISQDEICTFLDIAKGITQGNPRGQIDKKFGNIYWEPEELAYLRMTYKEGDPKEYARRKVLHGRKNKKRCISRMLQKKGLLNEEGG